MAGTSELVRIEGQVTLALIVKAKDCDGPKLRIV